MANRVCVRIYERGRVTVALYRPSMGHLGEKRGWYCGRGGDREVSEGL